MIRRRWSVLLQLLLIALVPVVYFLAPVTYVRLIDEDNWGEFSTSAAFLIAAALFAICYRAHRASRGRYWYLLLALAGFFVGMEEISWGQRILGLETPEVLARINLQNETTLHNIDWLNPNTVTTYRTLGVLCILLGFLVPLAAARTTRIACLVKRLGVPLPNLYLSPLFLATGYFLGWATLVDAWELGELFLGLSIVAMAADHAIAALPTIGSRSGILRRFFSIVSLGFLLWIIAFLLVLPYLIKTAYRGDSLSVLNDLITGQAMHGIDFYLDKGHMLGWSMLGLMLVACMLVLPFVIGSERLSQDRSKRIASLQASTVPLTLVGTLVAGIMLTQLAGIPGDFRSSLKLAGKYEFPKVGLHRQALDIIDYLQRTSRNGGEEYLNIRAFLLYELGRTDEARGAAGRVLAKEFRKLADEPSDADTLDRIAILYNNTGDRASAIAYWRRALEASESWLSTVGSRREVTRLHLWRALRFEKIDEPESAINEILMASKYCDLMQDAVLIETGIARNLSNCRPSEFEARRVGWETIEAMRQQLESDSADVDWCNPLNKSSALLIETD
jgi:hypothetical protein